MSPGPDSRIRVVEAWWAGVRAVDGHRLVQDYLAENNRIRATHLLAMGKAASAMATGALGALPECPAGLVISKYGHIDHARFSESKFELIESGHPVPDENSLYAGKKAIHFVESLDVQASLLVLVSGGASALVEQLEGGMDLEDLKEFTDDMLASQVPIGTINARRMEQSLVKGGKLLGRARCKIITVLAISDVEGDDIRVIGSGIGACDRPDANIHVIGSNAVARKAVAEYLAGQGLNIVTNSESLYGDVFDLSKTISREIVQGPPGAYLYGGEPVIELPENPGRGGRNQSLALAIAEHLQDHPGITVLAAGTDGTDGPTDAAGGLVDSSTFLKVTGARQALEKANAGEFLDSAGALFKSGPTGTNVMDILIAIKLTDSK